DHHGNVVSCVTNRSQDLHSRPARESPVDQCDVKRIPRIAQSNFSEPAIPYPVHRITRIFQPSLETRADHEIVFHDQNAHRGFLLPRAAARLHIGSWTYGVSKSNRASHAQIEARVSLMDR